MRRFNAGRREDGTLKTEKRIALRIQVRASALTDTGMCWDAAIAKACGEDRIRRTAARKAAK